MKKARERLVEDMNIERHELIASKVQTLDEVIQKASKSEQSSNVIDAVKLIGELTGCFPDHRR